LQREELAAAWHLNLKRGARGFYPIEPKAELKILKTTTGKRKIFSSSTPLISPPASFTNRRFDVKQLKKLCQLLQNQAGKAFDYLAKSLK
jgi:hypothetical protein